MFLRKIKTFCISIVCGLAVAGSNAYACGGSFYVQWVEAEASTQIYVRSTLVSASGLGDRYGVMTVPDDALGNPNPNYIYQLLVNAFMNNSKLFITTDDTDCEISSSGENLGTISDVQSETN